MRYNEGNAKAPALLITAGGMGSHLEVTTVTKYTPEQRIAKFWSRVDKSGGENACWIWTGARNPEGYGSINWYRASRRSHRIAYELAFGVSPESLCVLHKCDNPRCCNPAHLFLGTSAENNTDRKRKNRTVAKKGEDQWKHKLTANQVAEIRHVYSFGLVSQRELASRFGVQQTTIWNVVNYRTWKE
jgi:hypothetical protein